MIYGYPETPGRVPDGGIGLKGSPAVGHQVRCASLRDGPDTCREAGRTFDARVGNEDDGASRLHLIEVREDFYLKLALVEDITLAGEITLCLGDRGRIRVEGLVAIGGGVADLIDVLECLERPARCILMAVGIDAGQCVDIRPLLVPVAAKCHQCPPPGSRRTAPHMRECRRPLPCSADPASPARKCR